MHPTTGTVTQEFGNFPQASGEPWGHTGRDYGGSLNDPVYSIAAGTVLFADWSERMSPEMCDKYAFVRGSNASGIVVLIQHDGWVSVSAHLNATHLNAGDTVSRKTQIGLKGMTGRSTGVHLHFECIDTTHEYTYPFGRFDPALQIDWENNAAQSSVAPLTNTIETGDNEMPETHPNYLNKEQQQQMYRWLENLHTDFRQGIDGVQTDGDSFNLLRRIGQALKVGVDETARKKKHGRRKAW